MPLFRFVHPTPDTQDATFLFEANPDPERYEEVVDKPAKKSPASAPAESETEAN